MTYATYQDTQSAGAAFFAPPAKYALYLACAPNLLNRYVEVASDSDDPTKFVVVDIAANVRPDYVARHVAVIAIASHPDILMWSAVADLPAGRLVKSTRDGNVVSIDDATHWSGRRCIGWMN